MQERFAIPRTRKLALALLAAVSLMSSCSTEVNDPYCSSSALPDGASAKSGEGALLVEGTTRAYFYVADSTGKSIKNQTLGRTVALEPGKYQVKVNNTLHPVVVKKAALTKCSTGTLLVSGTTREHYYVQDPAGKSVQEEFLGGQLSLIPGSYRVKVNGTVVPAEVKLGQTTELKTGTLVAEAGGRDYFYVKDKAGNSLSERKESTPLSLFPGEYSVKLGANTRAAAVDAGQATLVKF